MSELDTTATAGTAAGAPPVLHLTAETFDEAVAGAEEPLLVDFWAEWCHPCKLIAPILDEIAVEHAGKIRVAKLDIDHAQEIARRFDILSIPTLILFKDGQPELRIRGAKGKGSLLQELDAYL